MLAWTICIGGEKFVPPQWATQHGNKSDDKSIILEVVVDQSLWIWHAYFGMLGSNNDLNILDMSLNIRDIISARTDV